MWHCPSKGIQGAQNESLFNQDASAIGIYSIFVIGNEHALSALNEPAGHWAETDSAANQFGAPESIEDPHGTFPLACGPCLFLAQLSDVWTGEGL